MLPDSGHSRISALLQDWENIRTVGLGQLSCGDLMLFTSMTQVQGKSNSKPGTSMTSLQAVEQCRSDMGVTHTGDNVNATATPSWLFCTPDLLQGLSNTWPSRKEFKSHLTFVCTLASMLHLLWKPCSASVGVFILIHSSVLGSIKTPMVWVGGALSYRAQSKDDPKMCLLRCKNPLGHCNQCHGRAGLTQQHLQTPSYQLGRKSLQLCRGQKLSSGCRCPTLLSSKPVWSVICSLRHTRHRQTPEQEGHTLQSADLRSAGSGRGCLCRMTGVSGTPLGPRQDTFTDTRCLTDTPD